MDDLDDIYLDLYDLPFAIVDDKQKKSNKENNEKNNKLSIKIPKNNYDMLNKNEIIDGIAFSKRRRNVINLKIKN